MYFKRIIREILIFISFILRQVEVSLKTQSITTIVYCFKFN